MVRLCFVQGWVNLHLDCLQAQPLNSYMISEERIVA